MSSDSVAPPSAEDTCPYCLKFEGFEAERAGGCRFCPLCGSDWETLDRSVPVSGPIGSVNPFEGLPLPLQAPPPQMNLTDSMAPPQVLPPRVTPVPLGELQGLPVPQFEPPPVRVGSALGPATVGLMVGLAVTLAVAFFVERVNAPEQDQPTARRALVVPDAVLDGVAAAASRPVATTPAPDLNLPVLDVEAMAAADLPSPRKAPGRTARAVEQAIALASKDLPAASHVQIKARVDDGIAFLRGRVDSPSTLKLVSTAASDVFGIRAVDSRGVRVAFRKHIVRSGDTLSALAGRYYGRRSQWLRLWDANKHLAKSPEALVIGEALLIPTD